MGGNGSSPLSRHPHLITKMDYTILREKLISTRSTLSRCKTLLETLNEVDAVDAFMLESVELIALIDKHLNR